MINGYRQALFLFSVFFIVVCSTLWTTTIQAVTRTKTHHLSQSKSIQAPPPTTAAPNTTSAATNTTTAAPANTTAAPANTNTTTGAPTTWRSRTRTLERSPQHQQGSTTSASTSTTHAPNTTSNQTTQAPPQTTPTTTSAPPQTTHHYYHSVTRTQQREEPSTTSSTPAAPPNTTSNTTTTKAPATPAPTQQPHQRTATREVSPSPMSITPEGDRTSTVSPSTTIRPPTTPPPTTTQKQQPQTSTSQAQQRGTSTTAAAVSTTTEAPSPTPKPKKRNPRVEFVLANIARGRTNTTAANFKTLLAEMLSIPANAMSVTYDESAGVMLVEFKEDATDSSGKTLNATAEFEKAVTLDTTQLNNLGAASVSSTEPAPAPEDNNNNDDGKKPNLGLILGIVGGVLVLAVVAYIIKVKSSGTTGSKYEESADPHGTGFVPTVGDRPMLEVPQHHSHHAQL